MDKEAKIIDLRIKIIELELEKERIIHRNLFSVIVGVITFLFTSGIIINSLNSAIKEIVKSAIVSIPLHISIPILILGVPSVVGLIGYIATKELLNLYLKSTKRIYGKRIEEIQNIILNISSNKKK